jgi:AcrR family transcriptional regulator
MPCVQRPDGIMVRIGSCGRVSHVSSLQYTLYLSNSRCLAPVTYTGVVPKLWDETIEAHRGAVREAILDTTALLVAKHGLLSATMSRIAEEAGIGRATLYKYFADLEAILSAWHERQVAGHLEHLAGLAKQPGDALGRLEAVLEGYARIQHDHHGTEIAALLHRGAHVAHARHHLTALLRGLLADGARAGGIRDDVTPEELATYCVHALSAAATLRSKAAVGRLVAVVLSGLRSRA